MSKIRIYELAKQLGVANKDLVAKINSIGIEAKSHMAMLTEEEACKGDGVISAEEGGTQKGCTEKGCTQAEPAQAESAEAGWAEKGK